MTAVDVVTGEIDTTLTPVEAEILDSAERTIERGLTSFMDVGDALAEILERRLYRQTHRTFEDYCRERWSITDRRARQLIQAAATVGGLESGTTVPINEAQARALAAIPEEDRAEVMALVGKLTAGAITAAYEALIAERSGEGEAPSPRPPRGNPNPSPTDVVRSVIGRVSKVNKKAIQEATTERLADLSDDDWQDVQRVAQEIGQFTSRVVEAGRLRRTRAKFNGGNA